jgi:predicted nucleic acid-binding protein
MGHVANPELLNRTEGPEHDHPLVFLDTKVIIAYLTGEPSAAQLFSAEAEGRIRFAINPIVIQELLLALDLADHPEFELVRDHLRVLPLDFPKAEALVPRARALPSRLVHTNDILILSSAVTCDFFVTRDEQLKTLVTDEKLHIVTPEELVTHLRAA